MSCINSDSVSAYSLTMTTSGSLTANVLPNTNGGIGTTVVTDNVSIASNCRAGYTLTITGPTDNNLYLNGDSTNNASGTYFAPVDGTSPLKASANVNKWGYSLTADTGIGIFSVLSSTPATLRTPSQTASPDSDIDTTIPIYYGTSVNGSMAPGSYTFPDNTSITYTAVMDTSCTTYSVQYQDNGADNPNGMGTTNATTGEKSVRQINIAEDIEITLLAPNFKKSGYAFLGWSTDSQAYAHFTDNDNTNDPIIYGPNEGVVIDASIMATANNRNQINMYAVWIPALKDGNNNPVYMQEWDNPNTTIPYDGCSTLTATVFDDTVVNEKDKIVVTKDSVVALTDKRDNEIYTVARLADGNCWMVENLRLEHEGTVGYNINDSSVTNKSLSQGFSSSRRTGRGEFLGLAESEDWGYNSTEPNSIYKSDDSGDTYNPLEGTLEDIGITDYTYARFPRYNNGNTREPQDSPTYTQNYSNPNYPSNNPSTNYYKTQNVYSKGNEYTWAAAVASTGMWTSFGEVLYTSICPSNGWILPPSGKIPNSFGALSQSYGGTGNNQSSYDDYGDVMSNRFRTFPNNFILSHGSGGYYWTRKPYSDVGAIYLDINESILWPSYNNLGRTSKFSVRCMISPSNATITFDSNDGTGRTTKMYGTPGFQFSPPGFYRENYAIESYNTAIDGSGTNYRGYYTIPAGSTAETLYAQWVAQYYITYVNNCMSWASSDANCTQEKSDVTSTQAMDIDASGNGSGRLGAYNKYNLTGWKIKEWTTNADGTGTTYATDSTYAVTGANPGDSITLYAHWVPTYSIQYDGNGSDNDATGMGSLDASTGKKTVRHDYVATGDTFDLFASNFKRAGYGFIGWSTDAEAWNKLTDNDTTNDVRIWGPNEVFVAPAFDGNTIRTLYAIWVPAETSSGNPVYLQNWTGCSALTATVYDSTTNTLIVAKNSITVLTDQRDNEVYAVAKLADGNCWMIENLRLADSHNESGNVTSTVLSTANTNIIPSNNTLPITNVYNADDSLAIKSNSLSPSSSANYNASSAPYGWCSNQNAACNNQSRLNTTNVEANITPSQVQRVGTVDAHDNFNTTIYSYGNYYNWYSATAGYGTFGKSSGNTEGDLCPAGWKLPSGNTGTNSGGGNTSGGFYYLAGRMNARANNQDSTKMFRTFPNNFVYSGVWSGNSAVTRGQSGNYWSSTAYTDIFTYYLTFKYLDIKSGTGTSNKYSGHTVRCVLPVV